MATATILPAPRFIAYDQNGDPLSLGSVHTYIPGGTTPSLTWEDAARTTPNANPVPLDSAGSALIYGAGNYQLTVVDANGVSVPGYSGLSSDGGLNALVASAPSAAMTPVIQATTLLAGAAAFGVIPTFASIAALRANVQAETIVYVQGYYGTGTLGGGAFSYVATDTTTADNGGTVIVDAANHRWYRERAGPNYPVSWFGAKGDGTTDDLASITACLAALVVNGGGLAVFEALTYKHSNTITIANSFVGLWGVAANGFSEFGTPLETYATRLLWSGSTGVSQVLVSPVSGASSRKLFGCSVQNITFDGATIAEGGLQVMSHENGTFQGLTFIGHVNSALACLYTGVVATLGGSQSRDCQHNLFRNMVMIQEVGQGTGVGVFLTGDATANTSLNTFDEFLILHTNQSGIFINSADSNNFGRMDIQRAGGGASGVGLSLAAGASTNLTANNNYFDYVFANGGINAQGTGDGVVASSNNVIRRVDTANGTPIPTVGIGTTLRWGTGQAVVNKFGDALPNYNILDNNQIMQWGTAVVPKTSSVTVTLALGLTFAIGSLQVTAQQNAGAALSAVTGLIINTTQISLTNTDAAHDLTVDYFLIST